MRTLCGLKVCFVAGTLGNGGAERQLFYILRALCAGGASPQLLSMDKGAFWEERIKALGIGVTGLGERRPRLVRLHRLMKEIRKCRPDVLQSQHFYTNAYVALAAWLSGLSGIGAMRNNGLSEVSDSGSLGGRLNLHWPRMIAANSHVAIRYAIERGISASRLYFLPNVVDTEWFKPGSRGRSPSPPAEEWEGERPREPITLLAVGRLVKQKRLDRFISILHRLRTDFHLNVKGLIVGNGRPDELEDQARKLGLLPHGVQFVGTASDMRSVYHQAAVCVLTSDHEGTPNVLLEAMACGLPVVSTNVGGVPDIVRHGETGFLCDPENLDGLVGFVSELVKDRMLRTEMGKRARTFVERNHSLERLPAYLDNLYRLALPRTGALGRPQPSLKYENV